VVRDSKIRSTLVPCASPSLSYGVCTPINRYSAPTVDPLLRSLYVRQHILNSRKRSSSSALYDSTHHVPQISCQARSPVLPCRPQSGWQARTVGDSSICRPGGGTTRGRPTTDTYDQYSQPSTYSPSWTLRARVVRKVDILEVYGAVAMGGRHTHDLSVEGRCTAGEQR
jgi:hypothetical protein